MWDQGFVISSQIALSNWDEKTVIFFCFSNFSKSNVALSFYLPLAAQVHVQLCFVASSLGAFLPSHWASSPLLKEIKKMGVKTTLASRSPDHFFSPAPSATLGACCPLGLLLLMRKSAPVSFAFISDLQSSWSRLYQCPCEYYKPRMTQIPQSCLFLSFGVQHSILNNSLMVLPNASLFSFCHWDIRLLSFGQSLSKQ